MRITSAGNVGIGTTAPVQYLHINGNDTISSIIESKGNTAVNSTTLVLRRSRDNAGAPSAVQAEDVLGRVAAYGYQATGWNPLVNASMVFLADENYSDTANGTRIEFATTYNTTASPLTRMTIDSSGYVGIGTNAPIDPLHVATADTTTYVATGTGATPMTGIIDSSIRVQNGSLTDDSMSMYLSTVTNAAGAPQTAYAGAVAASTGWSPHFVIGQRTALNQHSERMRIESTGNVGIGTTTPTTKLEVSGAVTAKALAQTTQSISINSASTVAADGSGVVLLTQTAGTNTITTITGCDSGAVVQNQTVTFVIVGYVAGSLTLGDTAVGTATADSMILSGSGNLGPMNSAANRGATFTFLCTTIAGTKRWVEISRSSNTN